MVNPFLEIHPTEIKTHTFYTDTDMQTHTQSTLHIWHMPTEDFGPGFSASSTSSRTTEIIRYQDSSLVFDDTEYGG